MQNKHKAEEVCQVFFLKDHAAIYFALLGDLKESPSLGESSHVTFDRMAKYSSLTVLHILRKNSQKLSRKKFSCTCPEVYVQSGERYKNMFCFYNI